MSQFFRCDATGCDARATGTYRADENRWILPEGWKSFELDDWQIHGCSAEHLEMAKHQKNELTPFLGSWVYPLRLLPRKEPET